MKIKLSKIPSFLLVYSIVSTVILLVLESTLDTNGHFSLIPHSSYGKIGEIEISKLKQLRRMFPLHIYNKQYNYNNNPEALFDVIEHPGMFMAQLHHKEKNDRKHSSHYSRQSHPSEPILKLEVPRFWSPNIFGRKGVRHFLGEHGKRLMTPEEAGAIGSFNWYGRETIFVAIASYRDPECTRTIEELFLRAAHPERIRIAILDQRTDGDPMCGLPPELSCEEDPSQVICKYSYLLDRLELPAHLSIGTVFARHLTFRMYRGEYYAMQIDAHSRFIKGWDEEIISQWKATKNEMAVISVYPYDTEYYDPETQQSLIHNRPIMCQTDFEARGKLKHLRHGVQPSINVTDGVPTLHPFWGGGFSFSRGHFFIHIPYDQYGAMVFQGDEPNICIRAFTYGYDMYTFGRPIIFHMYGNGKDKDTRKKIVRFEENKDLYKGAAEEGMKRMTGIIGMGYGRKQEYFHTDEEDYGIGQVRPLDQFYRMYGIDPTNHVVYGDLCDFAEFEMNDLLLPHLREDRMGIDFSQINYAMPGAKKGRHQMQKRISYSGLEYKLKSMLNNVTVSSEVESN